MLKIFKVAVVVNLLLVALFVYTSYLQWDMFRGNNLVQSNIYTVGFNPLTYTMVFHCNIDGYFHTVMGLFTYPNFPYWLFFITVIVNLALMWRLQKTAKDNKPTLTQQQ